MTAHYLTHSEPSTAAALFWRVQDLCDWIAAGRLKLRVEKIFPWRCGRCATPIENRKLRGRLFFVRCAGVLRAARRTRRTRLDDFKKFLALLGGEHRFGLFDGANPGDP